MPNSAADHSNNPNKPGTDRSGKVVNQLIQLRVLSLRLFQDWDFGVGIFPKRKKVLIGRLGLGDVALQHISATEAKMGKRTDWLHEDEAAMVVDLLELGGSLATLMRSQIGFATDKDWKHRGPFRINGSRPPKLIRYGDPKTRNGDEGVSSVEREPSADGRQIVELHDGVFRVVLGQIVGQYFRSRVIPGVGKRERGKILQIAARRDLQCQTGPSPRFVDVAEPGFSQSGGDGVEGGRVLLSCALGVIHRAPVELAGVFKMPEIGAGIAFHTQHLVSELWKCFQLCSVLRYFYGIVFGECELIHDAVDEGGM